MAESDRINTIWTRLENWYILNMPEASLPSGASASDIQSLESHLNLTLPEGLKASLQRHNGVDYGVFPGGSLLSVNDIKKIWGMKNGMFGDGKDFDELAQDHGGKVQKKWWCASWVPIHHNSGDVVCVDMKPGENGKLGQILRWSHETGPRPKFEDYEEYLVDVAMQLESGKYKNVEGYLEENY